VKLSELAEALGLAREGDPALAIDGVAGLEGAGPRDLSFVTGERYRAQLRATHAAAVLAPAGLDVEGRACLRSLEPYADFARAILLFHPRPRPAPGIHPTAVIAPDAEVGPGVCVAAYSVIGARARIGAGAVIHPHVTVYPDAVIGADCELHAGCCVRERVRLGARVVVQNGAVIGAEGFGFAFRADGTRVRVPHTLGVEIGDECEIDANATIDGSHPGHADGSGRAGTRLGRAVKVDSGVQVGHGSTVGDGSTLCAHVALAGGTHVGRGVFLGGMAASAGHNRIGDGALLGGATHVHGDVPAGAQLLGSPAVDRRLFGRMVAAWKRLPDLLHRVRRIEKRLGIEP
jgi:UDP-3-O-[3-hydroxymyristoyl] glucosamine N-acyltransferase